MNKFLFGVYPYIAVTICILGCWFRHKYRPESWKADSDLIFCRCRVKRVGNIFLHLGIIPLLLGHIVGLLTPHEVYEPFMSPATKQMIAMIGGGILGGMIVVGLVLLFYRRIAYLMVRKNSTPMDYLVLVFLLLTVVTGLGTIPVSAGHPDGRIMVALGEWAQRIVTFRPGAADFVANVPLIYKAHILFGLTTLFTIFPFTRLVHAISGFTVFGVYPLRPAQIIRTFRVRIQ